MDPVSVAAVALGTSVARSAFKLWCGDNTVEAGLAETVADLLKDRFVGAIEQRRVARMFESFADTVAEKVLELNRHRFRDLPQNECEAAILAVQEVFAAAPFSNATLYRSDLDARYLERTLRRATPQLPRRFALNEQGTAFFDLVLIESCTYVLEIVSTLPRFVPGAFAEVLRRLTAIEESVNRVLERIPARDVVGGDDGFAADYRRQLVRQLDRMELFGATVSEANRGYPLSVAYISLHVNVHRNAGAATAPTAEVISEIRMEDPTGRMRAGYIGRAEGVPVTAMLATSRRMFVRGEAGCGKTTLLQWIAVSAAHQAFPSELADWNQTIPFFIPLRRYAQAQDFPTPEHFLDAVGQFISTQMPPGWVQRMLESGRALLLVDGVDELPAERRPAAQAWLRDLTTLFPKARCVVTSRPVAAPPAWLSRLNFTSCVIQPMAPSDIRRFVSHWHDAMRSMTPEPKLHDELGQQEQELQRLIVMRRDLWQLATNPLLCALLCALHRDRRTLLPHGRIELYRVALEMFLQRRDAERMVTAESVPLSFADKYELLQDLAYWLMRNGLTEASRDRIHDRLKDRLKTRRLITASPENVLTTLLERSGLLREPEIGHIDFVHRTFQEYLAAQAALTNDDIGVLVEHAADDQWHQAIVLAAGLGTPKQRNALLSSLLDPPRKLRADQTVLNLVALASMETAGDLAESQAREITRRARHLLPPTLPEHVNALSAAGDLALELIKPADIANRIQARYTAQLAARIGSPTGLALIEQLAKHQTLLSVHTLVSLWEYFDPDEYARRILSGRSIHTLELASASMAKALDALPNLQELDCRFNEPWEDYSFLEQLTGLRTVKIVAPFGSSHLGLSLPPKLATVIVTSRAGVARNDHVAKPGIAKPPLGPDDGVSLEITGLDSARILAHLQINRPLHTLLISEDQRIQDLRNFALPSTVRNLTLDGCSRFESFEGAATLNLPFLRSITIDRVRSTAVLDFGALLARRAYGDSAPLVDQLESIHVGGGDVGDLVYQLANAGMRFNADRYWATWTRRPTP